MRSLGVALLVLLLLGFAGSGWARAQGDWRGDALHGPAGAPWLLVAEGRGRMSRAEREQLRRQLRSADRELYRNERRRERRARGAPGREPHWRLSPAQREQLRRDIIDANRRFRRR